MTERDERKTVKGIKFTDKDRQTVLAVYEARYLTAVLIGRLLYPPTTQAYCRLRTRYLFDKGYPYRRRMGTGASYPYVYFLGRRGRNFVAETNKLDIEWVKRIAGTQAAADADPFLFMRHDLTLSALYVDLRLQCQSYGWDYEWKNARVLELEKLGVQPDAWMMVAQDGRVRESYIEFTREVPPAGELDKRIAAYRQLALKDHPVTVLWFTTSLAKVKRIMDRVIRHTNKEWFLVADIRNKSHFLTRETWWYCAEKKLVRFLQPPAEQVLYRQGGR